MPFLATGGAKVVPGVARAIRFACHGCTNRPFLHMVVMEKDQPREGPVIEQLGTFDIMPNMYGEKLCSLNLERIIYWIGEGAEISKGCQRVLGLAGLLPIHPHSYISAWENRARLKKEAENSTEAQQGAVEN